MALDSATGTFSLNASTGNQSVTGLGFQGKCGVFWTVAMNAAGAAANVDASYGVAVSSTERGCITGRADDAASTMDVASGNSNAALLKTFTDATATPTDLEVDFVSWDSDGFTVNVVDAPGSTVRVHYVVWGGSTITDAAVTAFATTATATQAVTGVGFTSDMILFLNNRRAAGATGTHHSENIGICTGVGEEGAYNSVDTDNSANSECKGWSKAVSLMGNFSGTSTTVQLESRVTTIGSDGFTLTHDTQSSDGENVIALCVSGGDWKLLADSQKTSTGTKSKTGMGFEPIGLLGISGGIINTTSPTRNDAVGVMGAYKGGTEHATAHVSDDAAATSDANKIDSATKFLVMPLNNGSTTAECDVTTLDVDGYTLDWTTADAVAREFFVLGWSAGGAVSPKPKSFAMMGCG
jgi:hypothetical protein